MGVSSFRKKTEFSIHSEQFVLLKKIDESQWQAENTRNGRLIEISDDQLRNLYSSGELIFLSNRPLAQQAASLLQEIPKNDSETWDTIKIKRAYVMHTLKFPKTKKILVPVIEELWQTIKKPKKPPSADSVIRWRNKFEKYNHNILSLVDRNQTKGNRSRRYPNDVLHFVQDAIDNIYLRRENNSIELTADDAKARIILENKLRPEQLQLPIPETSLIKAEIHKISAYDRCAARKGKDVANAMFRADTRQKIDLPPLECAEIDHTKLDIFVIDKATSFPLGRPWLTICLDSGSRCLLGISISFTPPSYLSVADCLRHAFLPKTHIKEKYPDIVNGWEPHGLFRELVVDNGLEFHCESLENACLTLGIEIRFCARKMPWHKGKVERFIGTLNKGLTHSIPGTTFSNIFEKGDYDPKKHAILDLEKLREVVYTWVCDVYHQKTHHALGMPPIHAWRTGITSEEIFLPHDLSHFDTILGTNHQRTLTHAGININSLTYNSLELAQLRRNYGEKLKVDVRVNESDLSYITVLHEGIFKPIKVPSLKLEYTKGLSLWQHKVCKKYAIRNHKNQDIQSWLLAKHRIRKIIDSEIFKSKTLPSPRIMDFADKTVSRSVVTKGVDLPLINNESTIDKKETTRAKTFEPQYRDRS